MSLQFFQRIFFTSAANPPNSMESAFGGSDLRRTRSKFMTKFAPIRSKSAWVKRVRNITKSLQEIFRWRVTFGLKGGCTSGPSSGPRCPVASWWLWLGVPVASVGLGLLGGRVVWPIWVHLPSLVPTKEGELGLSVKFSLRDLVNLLLLSRIYC
jgi:hypothetical protein